MTIVIFAIVKTVMCIKSRLYHSLDWYRQVYTTRDYSITYLYHGRLTPDTVLRDRRQE